MNWLARLKLTYLAVRLGVPFFEALRWLPTRPMPQPPGFDVFSPAAWDVWWKERLAAHTPPIELCHLWEPIRPALPRMRAENARSVLSVGCGICLDLRAFAAAGLAVTGLDISSVAIEYARTTVLGDRIQHFLDDADLRPGGTLELAHGDLFDSAQCPGPYDVVLCRSTIQYFHFDGRLPAAIAAIADRLAPSGLLIIGTHGAIPAFYAIDDALVAAGFRLVNRFEARPSDLFPTKPGERLAWHVCSTG